MMKRHIKTTNICAEDYLWNETANAIQMLAVDRLLKYSDKFMWIQKSNQYSWTEMEENDWVSKDNTRNMSHKGQMKRHI